VERGCIGGSPAIVSPRFQAEESLVLRRRECSSPKSEVANEYAAPYNVKSMSSKCQVYVKFSLADVKFFQRFLWRFRGISMAYTQCQALFQFCQVFLVPLARASSEPRSKFFQVFPSFSKYFGPKSKFFQIFPSLFQIFQSFSKSFSLVVLWHFKDLRSDRAVFRICVVRQRQSMVRPRPGSLRRNSNIT
jgi:hypothetical protein